MVARACPAGLPGGRRLRRGFAWAGHKPQASFQPLHSGMDIRLRCVAAQLTGTHGFPFHDGIQPKLGTVIELQPAVLTR